MRIWADDTLIVHYVHLGPDAYARLTLLNAIGVLLVSPVGSQTQQSLGLEMLQWCRLRVWLEQVEGDSPWHVEPGAITVLRPTEQHVVVGTNELLRDLRSVTLSRVGGQSELAPIWRAARRYVAAQIIGGGQAE